MSAVWAGRSWGTSGGPGEVARKPNGPPSVTCAEVIVSLELVDRPEVAAEHPSLVLEKVPARLRHIALLGNFPPRRCGIATFTADVEAALAGRFPDIAVDVYAMND